MIRESLRNYIYNEVIPGSPNEAPLKQLREIIKDEPRLRTIFESVYAEES
jgi:hypothetical protein